MTVEIARYRLTVEDYYRMGEVGILPPDARVELIDGEIVEMSPIGSPHAACVDRLNRLLGLRAGERALVRVQNPVRLGRRSEPQPDLALLRPRPDFYAGGHPGPGDVWLVVEVAETTLAYDREVKGPLYAAAGVPELWVVDLGGQAVEVRRQPGPAGYGTLRRASRGERLGVEALPGVELDVDEVLG